MYAINEKRLQALERTVDIQTKMLTCHVDKNQPPTSRINTICEDL